MVSVLINSIFNKCGRALGVTAHIFFIFMWNDNGMMAAGINASASHVNLLASSLWNQRLNRQAFEQQTKLQEDAQQFTHDERLAQQDWTEGMYNKYETPSAQLRLLKEAGINPNSVGMGDLAGGSMPSAPSGASAGMGSAPSPAYIDGSALNNSIVSAAQAAKLLSETKGQNIENTYSEKEHQLSISEAETRIEQHRVEIDKIIAESNLTKVEATKLRSSLPYIVGLTHAQWENTKAATAKLIEDTENIKKSRDLLQEQIRTERSRQHQLESSSGALDASAELTREQKSNAEVENKILGYQKELRYLETQLSRARTSYESALYEDGIDPSKLTYDVHNLGFWMSTADRARENVRAKTNRKSNAQSGVR